MLKLAMVNLQRLEETHLAEVCTPRKLERQLASAAEQNKFAKQECASLLAKVHMLEMQLGVMTPRKSSSAENSSSEQVNLRYLTVPSE